MADLKDPAGVYRQVMYSLVVNGKDISQDVRPLLVSLRLLESRGEEADRLDITLDDSQGALALPPKGAKVELMLGYAHRGMVDKGTYTVDEVEHHGTPDTIEIRCRSADLRATLRQRSTQSWHDTTLGKVVRDIADKNHMPANVDEDLEDVELPHIDQTNESDVNFLTRLGRLHDAVATVKKGKLVFLPLESTRNAAGAELEAITLDRSDGDQHRYHCAARDSYTGVRAYWHDKRSGTKQAVIAGTEDNLKTLRDSYATEDDAMDAARSELGRIERGEATLEITLAIGQPALMVQTPVEVRGWKPEIDGTDWLCKTVEHTLGDNGLTTRMEMERLGADGTKPARRKKRRRTEN